MGKQPLLPNKQIIELQNENKELKQTISSLDKRLDRLETTIGEIVNIGKKIICSKCRGDIILVTGPYGKYCRCVKCKESFNYSRSVIGIVDPAKIKKKQK